MIPSVLARPTVASLLALLPLVACSSSSGKDSGDTAVDTDTDTDSDTDTEEEPVRECPAPDASRRRAAGLEAGTATIAGSIATFDGLNLGGMEVQVCDELCIPGDTLADGTFRFEALAAGSYKVDALGEGVEGSCYGRIRAHVDLADGATANLAAPLFVPRVIGPAIVSGPGTYTMGGVEWTVDPSTLDVPFGFEDDQFWTGVVAAADVPALWELPAPAAAAVSFLPFATEVSGAFTIAVTTDIADGSYEVWSVDAKGKPEGPLGAATAAGGRVEATVQPTELTWLFFVPVAVPVE
jgi:hypothetical protein